MTAGMTTQSIAKPPAQVPRGRMRKYVSAYDRLAQLPAVFTINTMVRATGIDRASARVVLTRWAGKNMVESAGPRTGIYFNRVVDRSGASAHAVRALTMKYPSATLCGASVLHSAGWTTQIPSTLHVAVEARNSYSRFDGVTLHPRRRSWFQRMQKHGAWIDAGDAAAAGEMTSYDLRALAPAWALADLYADQSGRSWQPREDDLDVPQDALPALRIACATLHSRPPFDIPDH